MHGGFDAHSKQQQQQAIEHARRHSTEECALRSFSRPFSAQQQQANEQAVDQKQYDRAVRRLPG
jgi:hypothetical protein